MSIAGRACTSSAPETSLPNRARRSDRADAIPESVSFGVAALSQQWGAEPIGRTRLRDDLPAMQRAAGEVAELRDVIVVTGGASVGEKDFAKAMFEPLGLDLVFSKVVHQARQARLARSRGGKLVIGLPGNPTSALVTARLFLAPLLAGLTGRPVDVALRWRAVPARLAARPVRRRARHSIARVR